MSDFKSFKPGMLGLTEVRFYEETIDHVVNHPERTNFSLPSLLGAVERGLIDPEYVEASYGKSLVFVDTKTTNQSGDPLRIPVKLVTPESGRVKTFYFATLNYEPTVVYRRPE